MGGYKPIYITGNKEGLIQQRQEFILPHDAYPILQNAFLFYETIRKKQGCEALGRLRRKFSSVSIGNSSASPWTFNLLTVSGYVSTANNANPGQVTTKYPHGLSNGDLVTISGIVGATGYNNTTFTITVVDPVNFTVGVNAGAFGAYASGGYWISNRSLSATEPNAELEPGSVVIVIGGAITFTDQGNGTLTSPTGGNSGTINYISGSITLTHTAGAGVATTASWNYFPSFPAMGVRDQETSSINVENTIFFDQKYAYRYTTTGFEELIPGYIWTGNDRNFFWSTNFWVNGSNQRLFWTTNFSGVSGDPIRYTEGTTAWTPFAPQIAAAGTLLTQCLCLLPFRSRLVAFNTLEGASLAASTSYNQRIRWAAIGDPNAAMAWRSDLPGKGGFLDIPTSQSIVAVGFVRDNLVIYCERSTWQLRYTGRAIQPFVVEKVNSELGAESTFSVVQFDTSLVGVGDKSIVQCDSYKSESIDAKIPNLVFSFNNDNQGPQRVCGARDFFQRIAYWMYPYIPESGASVTYPNRRLIYNYQNKSWAIFIDSFTCLGNFQPLVGRTWTNTQKAWRDCNFSWLNPNKSTLTIAGGNQQGFISILDKKVLNDPTLSIRAITGGTNAVQLTCKNHNLDEGQIITISDIPLGTPFSNYLNNPLQGLITAATQADPCSITSSLPHNLSTDDEITINGVGGMTELNGGTYLVTVTSSTAFTLSDLDGNEIDSTSFSAYTSGGTWTDQKANVFYADVIDTNTIQLFSYSTLLQDFNTPVVIPVGSYVGGGKIALRDNFMVQSKKFSYMDKGQNIQLGYIDVLMPSTEDGEITLNILLNYNDDSPINILPQNVIPATGVSDAFFNSVVPTNNQASGNISGTKYMQRVFCPARGNFITTVWTFSPEQMSNNKSAENVEIDAQVMWMREAGRMTNN